MKPLLSIIVPTWQRHGLLTTRLIPSVRALDMALECLIVSDGPDNAARAVVHDFGDARLRYMEVARSDYPADRLAFAHCKGVVAINAGIDHARGTWIGISGDDDVYEPGGLPALVKAARPEDDVVFGISAYLRADGSWWEAFDGPPGLRFFPTGGAIVRRSRLGARRFDPGAHARCRIGADLDFWRRLAVDGFRFRGIPEVVFRYHASAARAA